MNFLICWLLCAVAFAIAAIPPTIAQAQSPPIWFLRIVTAGVLIAIAISIVPGMQLR